MSKVHHAACNVNFAWSKDELRGGQIPMADNDKRSARAKARAIAWLKIGQCLAEGRAQGPAAQLPAKFQRLAKANQPKT
jgi:hypothetical protein